MRTVTTQQTATFAAKDKSTFVRVYVDGDGGGTYDTDLSTLGGRDWIDSVEWSDSIDSPGQTARIVLRREEYKRTLSPLVENSVFNQQPVGTYVPRIQIYRIIKIEVAEIPLGAQPVSADWVNVFEGRIDRVDWGSSTYITIDARDNSGRLQDAWIRNIGTFGSGGGQAVQTAMQNILNSWGNSVSLYTPSSPGWNILTYEQRKEPTFTALRRLAMQIGWDVRYKWDDGTSAWRLTFYGPDRAKVSPDYTFEDEIVKAMERLTLDKQAIRNRIRIIYGDPATSPPTRTVYEASDATSITKYDDLFMEVTEAATSNIDSAAEAQVMAEAILEDLKEPAAEAQVTVGLFWPAQLGDLYRFKANGIHFDVDQDLALVAYKHKVDKNDATSSLTVRGQPAGAYTQWLSLDGRGSVAPATDTGVPSTPTNGASVPQLGGLEVTYDQPTDIDWAYSECHVSASSGFTPSDATKVAQAKSTKFLVSGLILGTTYYVKIIAVDTRGNKSAASTQVVKATNYVGSVHQNLDSELGNCVPNGDFGHATPPLDLTTTPPDEWEATTSYGTVVDATAWANADGKVYYDETVQQTGKRVISMRLGTGTGPVGPGLRNKRIWPVTANRLYVAELVCRREDVNSQLLAGILFFQADGTTSAGTFTVTVLSGASSLPAATWGRGTFPFKTGSTAVFARAFFGGDRSAGANDQKFYVDRIGFYRSLTSFKAYRSSSVQTVTTAATKVELNTEAHDHGSEFDSSTNYRFVCVDDGDYAFSASVGLDSLPTTATFQCMIRLNGANIARGSTAPGRGAGNVSYSTVAVHAMELVAGDFVELYVDHSDAGSYDVVIGADDTFLSGHRVK